MDCQSCLINEILGNPVKENLTKSQFSTKLNGLQQRFGKYLCFEYIFSDTICLDTLRTVKVV